jgi:hypothetical protein
MSDDKTKRGFPDNALISINEPYEVQYWANKFGVSPQKLRLAVNAVGNSAAAVRNYLSRH